MPTFIGTAKGEGITLGSPSEESYFYYYVGDIYRSTDTVR